MNCIFSVNLKALGVTFILLAMVQSNAIHFLHTTNLPLFNIPRNASSIMHFETLSLE